MLKFAADENFNNNILRGLIRRRSDLDIVRIQDFNLSGADDPTVLEWTAKEDRILLTHDVATITKYAYNRIVSGESFPGVIEVDICSPISLVMEDILLLAELSYEGEWKNQIIYIPLK
jgi:hypothetical protein